MVPQWLNCGEMTSCSVRSFFPASLSLASMRSVSCKSPSMYKDFMHGYSPRVHMFLPFSASNCVSLTSNSIPSSVRGLDTE